MRSQPSSSFKRDSASDPEEKPHQAVAFSGLEEL